jgi:hypothetical protein
MEYMITFLNFNNKLCSYIIESRDLSEAMQVAKILSAGRPVTIVEVL